MQYVLDSSPETKSTIAELYKKYNQAFTVYRLKSDAESDSTRRLMLLNDSYTYQYVANTLRTLWNTYLPNLTLKERNEFKEVAEELNDPKLIALAEKFNPYVASKKARYKANSKEPDLSLYKLSLINRENTWRQSLSVITIAQDDEGELSEVPDRPSSPAPFR